MESFCVTLLAIGIACHIFSSALDNIIGTLDEYNKKREKKEKENMEKRKQQEKEAKERRAIIAARFEARAKAQAEEKQQTQ